MNSLKESLSLYAVTDRTWLNGRYLDNCVEAAIKGGVTMVQLREKKLATPDFLQEAEEIKYVCKRYDIPFIINDNLLVAMACDADGIHVGQDDLSAADIRKKWPEHKIIGVSAQTVAQAIQAEEDGADYLGVGAVFPTDTKDDASDVSMDELKAIVEAVSIPVVAIGGIHQGNIAEFYDTGVAGVALVSEIFDQADIEDNAKQLKQLVRPFGQEACVK